jgi:folate-binding protein YgfZ
MKQNHIFEPKLAGEKVRDLYRVENGLPSTPNEINDQYNPYEIDLIDEVDFEKGCYIGQEVIARLDTYQKVQRFLHKVKIKSDQELELPGDIFDSGDKKVGSLTSLVKRPESIEQIGLGIFRKKAMGDSNEFYIHTDQEKIKLKLVN